MSSLATVIFSACSAAISSSTGATILQGPHHVAQKSTSTVLPLPSTSLLNEPSVTVTVLPAMSSPRCRTDVCGCSLGGDGGRLAEGLVRPLGQPALGVDRGGATRPGRGDGLPVGVVDQVTRGEHTVQI